MKISRHSPLLAFALLWHVSCCDGAALRATKQQEWNFTNEVAPYAYGEDMHIPDEPESYVEGDTLTDGHRETKECRENQRVFFVTFTTDNRAEEISFELIGPNGGVIGRAPESGRRFQDNTQYTYRYCVWIGYQHKLRWKDTGGNGMCCQFGKGTYRYGIDGTKMYGSNMQKTFTSVGVHVFKVRSRSSSQSSLASGRNDDGGAERDDAWLVAHNVRRKKYHVQWGKSYVPLKWSPMLANQAKQWANQLATKCDGVSLSDISTKAKLTVADHEPGISYGENMASNYGNGANGELKTPDQILNRFVEMEMDDAYPNNYHMTQVLWRASKYVGCAESVRAIEGVEGGYCRFQVCRYATAGNCNMGASRYSDGKVNWKASVLNDELRRCGTSCTPEPEGWC